MENEDFVKCRICGWEGRQINVAHLWGTHRIKAKDYKKMFPDAPLTCESTKNKLRMSQAKIYKERPELRKQHGEKIKEIWENKDRRETYLNGFKKRKPPTEEHKRKISESMKKVYAEAGNYLRERHQNQYGENNPFFGKKHTEKTKETLAAKTRAYLIDKYNKGEKISPFKHLGRGKKQSKWEAEIDIQLKPMGFEYDYQIPFNKGAYLIDFALKSQKIAIEIDSKLHKKYKDRDKRKDDFLKSNGWTVYRFDIDTRQSEKDFALTIKEKVEEILNMETGNGQSKNKINQENRKTRKQIRGLIY